MICNSTDEPQKRDAEWKKLDRKEYVVYDSIHMKVWKSPWLSMTDEQGGGGRAGGALANFKAKGWQRYSLSCLWRFHNVCTRQNVPHICIYCMWRIHHEIPVLQTVLYHGILFKDLESCPPCPPKNCSQSELTDHADCRWFILEPPGLSTARKLFTLGTPCFHRGLVASGSRARSGPSRQVTSCFSLLLFRLHSRCSSGISEAESIPSLGSCSCWVYL